MNQYLNYLIEANAGLCIALLAYYLLFRNETDFSLQRKFLLTGIFFSLVFPLIHFQGGGPVIPSINDYVPTYWLPEVVIGDATKTSDTTSAHSYWNVTAYIYVLGVIAFLLLFLIQLFRIVNLIRKHVSKRYGKFLIAYTDSDTPSFSFFHFIFVNKSEGITENEQNHIIRHEMVHSQQLHSFDILLLNVAGVFFWFNPILRIYKKIFIQLHEFEADARAVKNEEVNDYCSLLARVALQSADYKIASHFNQSLTVKRINMIRTFKTKIRRWKLVATVAIAPVFFVVIACQDQIADDLNKIAENSSAALVVPKHVQDAYDKLVRENPSSKYVMIQPNEKAMETIKDLENRYGLPKSVHVYKNNPKDKEAVVGESENGVKITTTKDTPDGYVIIEFNEDVRNLAKTETGDVFVVVEKMPEYAGGLPALNEYIMDNLQYPDVAREANVEGTVYTQFIVNTDGSVSDVSIIKTKYNKADQKENEVVEIPLATTEKCEQEAIRVVKAMPAWTPGMQNGKAVRVKYVVPIKFGLG